MKVEKCINVDVDVEVEISLEDIVGAILEDANAGSLVLRGVSNCHRFLKAIPDEIIAGMNDQQRKTIHDAMLIEVNRFASKLGGSDNG